MSSALSVRIIQIENCRVWEPTDIQSLRVWTVQHPPVSRSTDSLTSGLPVEHPPVSRSNTHRFGSRLLFTHFEFGQPNTHRFGSRPIPSLRVWTVQHPPVRHPTDCLTSGLPTQHPPVKVRDVLKSLALHTQRLRLGTCYKR